MVEAGRCRSTTATPRTPRHRGSRRDRRAGAAADRASPSASVDSQIGPWTATSGSVSAIVSGRPSIVCGGSRAGTSGAGAVGAGRVGRTNASSSITPAASAGLDGHAERRERHDRVAPAVQGRPDQLGHTRCRGPPGARRDRGRGGPGRRASRRGPRRTGRARSRVGSAGDRPGSPRGAPAARGRTAPGADPARRAAGPRSRRRRRACRDPAGRRGAGRATASPRRTASRHASTAPSCDPTWRWTPRGRIAARSRASRSTVRRELRLGHPELRPAGPDRQARPASRVRRRG